MSYVGRMSLFTEGLFMSPADETDEARQTCRNRGTTEKEMGKGLNDIERLVITRVCLGLKNRQIATVLGLSYGEVKEHLKSIFDKLSVGDRLELIIYAFEHGLNPRHHIE
jgi:DNA-binding NarL/FixJ family response regulator